MPKSVPFTIVLIFFFTHSIAQSYTKDLGLVFLDDTENPASCIKNARIAREAVYSYQTKTKNGIRKTDSLLKRLISYDSTGRPVESLDYAENNAQITKYKYVYDTDNKLAALSVKTYTAHNILAETIEISYDSLGRESNMFIYDRDTANLEVRHKEYNTKGQLGAIYVKFNPGGYFVSSAYHYDSNGQLLKIDFYNKDKKYLYSCDCSYDESLHARFIAYGNNGNSVSAKTAYLFNKFGQLSEKKYVFVSSSYSQGADTHNSYLSSLTNDDIIPQDKFDSTGNRVQYFVSNSMSERNRTETREFLNGNGSGITEDMLQMTNEQMNDEQYVYNEDGTIAETDTYGNSGSVKRGLPVKMIRHYYFKM